MKHGRKLLPRKETDQRPVKLVPMVSANVTTETHAHQAQLVLQARQVWTANQVIQANLELKEKQAAETVDTFQPPNLAENAHQAPQGPKDLLDQLAKQETKANQVTTVVWAKTEASDPQDQPDPQETQGQMANQEALDQQAKTASRAPKVNQAEPEAQARMVAQDQKDQPAPMVTQDQQDQPVDQAQQEKTAVQVRKAQLAKLDQLEAQAKTPNTVLARDEAIKLHLPLHFGNCVSHLFQFRFQISVITFVIVKYQ